MYEKNAGVQDIPEK